MLALIPLLAAAQVEPSSRAEPAIGGEWRNPSGTVIILIAPCDEAVCGRVQWASDKATTDARKGGTDPLIGVELLSDIEPRGEGRWRARLFVPDLNKTSRVELRLLGLDRLKVTGCLVGRLACKSQVWSRTSGLDRTRN